jgi:hypothetical protein
LDEARSQLLSIGISSGWIVTPNSPSDAQLLDSSNILPSFEGESNASGGFFNRLVASSLQGDDNSDADSDALRASRQRLVYDKVISSLF